MASCLGMVGIPDCDEALEYHYTECSIQNMMRFEPVLNLESLGRGVSKFFVRVSHNAWCLQRSRGFWCDCTVAHKSNVKVWYEKIAK